MLHGPNPKRADGPSSVCPERDSSPGKRSQRDLVAVRGPTRLSGIRSSVAARCGRRGDPELVFGSGSPGPDRRPISSGGAHGRLESPFFPAARVQRPDAGPAGADGRPEYPRRCECAWSRMPTRWHRLRKAIAITEGLQRAMGPPARGCTSIRSRPARVRVPAKRRGAPGIPVDRRSGPNSTSFIMTRTAGGLEPGDLVVMDIGAEYGYYTADITRTVPVSGRFTPASGPLRAGARRAAGGHPGGASRDRRSSAWTRSRGSTCGRTRARCAGRVLRPLFVHGLSHWLGMDVHDVGPMRAAPRQDGADHRAGYIHPGGAIGVRIEDDVLVTADGHEVLSAGGRRQGTGGGRWRWE